jgi:hypothetical protein
VGRSLVEPVIHRARPVGYPGLVTLRQLVLHAIRHQEHHMGFVAEKRRALGLHCNQGLIG